MSLRSSPPIGAGWGAGGGEGAFLTLPRQGKVSKWHLELGLVSELCYPHLQSRNVTAAALTQPLRVRAQASTKSSLIYRYHKTYSYAYNCFCKSLQKQGLKNRG